MSQPKKIPMVNVISYLSVGYGLEGALPDGKVGRIMDDVAIPYLNKNSPTWQLWKLYKSFYNEIAAEYGWDGAVVPVTTIRFRLK